MSLAENKALARRFIEQVWDKGDLEAADAMLDPNLVTHNEPAAVTRGREAFTRFLRETRSASPSLRFTVEEMIAEGDKVATRIAVRGIAGEVGAASAIGIIRVRDGRIVEQWASGGQFKLTP